MKRTLVLWDIDGTLIVTRNAGSRAMEIAFERHFGRPGDLSGIEWAGRTDTSLAPEILRRNGVDPTPSACKAYLEAYLQLLPGELARGPQGRVLPGVDQLTAHFAADPRFAQGLLTGNLRRGAEHKLVHYRLWQHFPFGAFADDSPRREDLGPVALRRAAGHHGREFAAPETVIIGDTPHDIACARAFGARVIAVATGRHSTTDLAAHTPDAVFPDLAETEAVLRALVA